MPEARYSITEEGVPTLSPIFLPQGPPPLKRLRSYTVSTMSGMESYLHTSKSHSAFFQDLYIKIVKDRGEDKSFINRDSRILIKMIGSIYKDYKSAVDTVRREPISKTCKITQDDNLYRRWRLSRKAQ